MRRSITPRPSVRPWRALLGSLLVLAAALACSDGGVSRAVGPRQANDQTSNACNPDVTLPTVSSVTASPNVLWPPNHKFVPVVVAVQATDNCSAVTSKIVGVTSSEPVDGLGDGHTSPDWIVTGALTLLVRSERSGLNAGRTYTIMTQTTDAAGNATFGSTTVFVPHDQGKGRGSGR